ncbi:PDDEXK nuclease domain-containing protein [Lewinella sp. LCG006]|uniref:PDDEXK nuclease domain-containing protein n=1 Tax=Lewinella sp. LCG006 TaxID=3231911 RepID=UPI00345FD703
MLPENTLRRHLFARENTSNGLLLKRWLLGQYLAQALSQSQLNATAFFRQQAGGLVALNSGSCSVTELRLAYRFYLAFPIKEELDLRLRWQHYRLLLALANAEARHFYLHQSARHNWTARELERQIRTHFFQRQQQASPLGIKAHYVFDFLLPDTSTLSELQLEAHLCDQLLHLLLELGPGFSFVNRQQMLCLPGGQRYFVDLLFYHISRRCHLLIELKTTPLTHRDIGQLDTYVRLFDQQYRPAHDAPSIGLLLCPDFSPDLLRFSALADQNNLMVATYSLPQKRK